MLQIISSKPLFWVLLGTFIGLNVLDAHSTYLVLRPHYFYREKNPVARWFFRWLGIPRGIVIFKAVLMSILTPAMIYYAVHDVFTINIVLLVSGIIFCLVVTHNYRVHKKICEERNK